MKRIGLFLLTNIAVMIVLSIFLTILAKVFGINLGRGNMGGMLLIALVFGMGGAIISLLMSKWMALKSTGAQVIEQPRTEEERWLVETVRIQAKKAGIGMPDVAIYHSPEVNAFATGANKNKALVAVSSGLLHSMTRDEAEAVLGHEVSHIANGDMVTLTLIQGVVNTFVIFLARMIANVISSALSSNSEEGEGGLGFLAYMATVIVLEIAFGILASMIVAWFSRKREFRADAGGATLAGRHKMIAALQRLQGTQGAELEGQLAAFGINSAKKQGFAHLFMSHPPLEERIAALQNSNTF